MITEKDLRIAYTEIRNNTSIPEETLDFIIEAALEKLKENVGQAENGKENN